MLRFEGRLNGRRVRGMIDDAGVCHAPLPVRLAIEGMASAGTRVGLGPWSGPASLLDPMAARATVWAALDHEPFPSFEGDPVPVEKLPDGAVA